MVALVPHDTASHAALLRARIGEMLKSGAMQLELVPADEYERERALELYVRGGTLVAARQGGGASAVAKKLAADTAARKHKKKHVAAAAAVAGGGESERKGAIKKKSGSNKSGSKGGGKKKVAAASSGDSEGEEEEYEEHKCSKKRKAGSKGGSKKKEAEPECEAKRKAASKKRVRQAGNSTDSAKPPLQKKAAAEVPTDREIARDISCHRCKTRRPLCVVCPLNRNHRVCIGCLQRHHNTNTIQAEGCPICQHTCTCPQCRPR
eukprot:TRINITY_DN17544_c0_g1_i1.p3 TRINITY_DN17544_c0_g1~~TRINITY_DN17544_c0_g1_i1.p3  ORF type:complete len:264 (+),score=98.32 TRINITY_DN17544_c0_g1_i1:237-1028(+)